jgi:hypothetical protein
MPADYVIVTGDMIRITIFPPTTVLTLTAPVPLKGSSSDMKVNHMAVCLEGDELPAMLKSPQPYVSPPFVIPGTGTLSLKLNPNNKTMQSKNGKPILIKGAPFTAEFQVASPAMQPTPGGPVPDSAMKKSGIAEFITTNVRVKAG